MLGRKPKDFDVVTSATPERHPAPVQELPDHRAPLPPRAHLLRTEDHRDVHVPRQPARDRGGGRRRRELRDRERRPADPPRQRLRHARAGRPPARLHDQRTVLRPRDQAGHRPRERHARSRGARRPHHRRSRHPLPRGSDPHPARREVRGPLRSDHRARDLPAHDGAPAGDREVRAGARVGGVLPPAARGRGQAIDGAAAGDGAAGDPGAGAGARPQGATSDGGRGGAAPRAVLGLPGRARSIVGACGPCRRRTRCCWPCWCCRALRDALDPDSNGVRDIGQMVAQVVHAGARPAAAVAARHRDRAADPARAAQHPAREERPPERAAAVA